MRSFLISTLIISVLLSQAIPLVAFYPGVKEGNLWAAIMKNVPGVSLFAAQPDMKSEDLLWWNFRDKSKEDIIDVQEFEEKKDLQEPFLPSEGKCEDMVSFVKRTASCYLAETRPDTTEEIPAPKVLIDFSLPERDVLCGLPPSMERKEERENVVEREKLARAIFEEMEGKREQLSLSGGNPEKVVYVNRGDEESHDISGKTEPSPGKFESVEGKKEEGRSTRDFLAILVEASSQKAPERGPDCVKAVAPGEVAYIWPGAVLIQGKRSGVSMLYSHVAPSVKVGDEISVGVSVGKGVRGEAELTILPQPSVLVLALRNQLFADAHRTEKRTGF